MRAAIAAETAGIPSVSIVCRGFEKQASATGRGLGFDGLRLAVLDGHVDAQSAEVMLERFDAVTVDQVVDGLVGQLDDASHAESKTAEPSALDIVATGTAEQINAEFLARGWTDGNPILPPTRAAVEALLAAGGHDPWAVLGIATSSGRDMTKWSVAVNAVMAGCTAEHIPVLMAAAQILADPHYGVEHSGNTTGADALMIVSGPEISGLGFNSGVGALREGTHANTAVGRWLRLYLRNVFGFTTDEHDKATFGNSTRVVLAEDHETLIELGWPSLGADLGATAPDITSIARMNTGIIVGSVFGSTPEAILPYLGDGLARSAGWDLTHLYGLGREQFRPLIVLSPVLARTFANAGWTKQDVRAGLFAHARIPAWRFEKLIGDWSNLTPGRLTLVEHVELGNIDAMFAESDDPDRLVPIVAAPEQIMVAVAGDPNRTNAFVFANDGAHGDWTTAPVQMASVDDLSCLVPDQESGPPPQ